MSSGSIIALYVLLFIALCAGLAYGWYVYCKAKPANHIPLHDEDGDKKAQRLNHFQKIFGHDPNSRQAVH